MKACFTPLFLSSSLALLLAALARAGVRLAGIIDPAGSGRLRRTSLARPGCGRGLFARTGGEMKRALSARAARQVVFVVAVG